MSEPGRLAIHRGKILANHALPGDYGWLRVVAPPLAVACRPGQFVHVVCDDALLLRRPFSIYNADPQQGVVEILYRVVGQGTKQLASRQPGDLLDMLGPIGRGFTLDPATPALLIGGGVGLAPLHFLAHHLQQQGGDFHLLIGLEGVIPFPLVAGGVLGLAPEAMVAAGLPVLLASQTRRDGFFHGFVTQLAEQMLVAAGQSAPQPRLFACGPHPMLKAVAAVAERFGLQGEVSLEAHMACGFGGCAGCVAPVLAAAAVDGWGYRRVCVDGPVFGISQVAWHCF